MDLIKQHKSELIKLCERFFVHELYVFGSILSNNFSNDSDIDFLVHFAEINPMDYFDNYMDFKESLGKLFNRKIDLVEIQTLKNPILKKSIEKNKTIVYGGEDSKVAV